MTDTFKCAMCGGTFDKEWSDAEALAEAAHVFGPEGMKEPLEIVCDGCYLTICPGGKPWGTS